jgi:hypothetical protein
MFSQLKYYILYSYLPSLNFRYLCTQTPQTFLCVVLKRSKERKMEIDTNIKVTSLTFKSGVCLLKHGQMVSVCVPEISNILSVL